MIRSIRGFWTPAARDALRELVKEAEDLLDALGAVRRVEIMVWRPNAPRPSLADIEEIVLATKADPRAVVLDRADLEWHLPDTELEPLAFVLAAEVQKHPSERLYWLVYEIDRNR
ncbi:hypothetical protein Dxin01_04202 [Deinococcus xinjiangensis]|uniref:Uncharacterized protein n=1 Tax=Deinococcus xinjiangensis TaxID=457454 RepID=A0ABP9VGU7_9DEIO